jgi:succinylarginine dihydrolase
MMPDDDAMDRAAYEVNFDGIVGPTHNYAGLSFGNVASQKHGLSVSNPREAALQGLAKMKFLAGLGLKQGVLPPQERPDLRTLRKLGFAGSDSQVIEQAYRQDPRLLAAIYSASSMWAANAATVSPAADTADGRVHFTPANLVTQFHRSLESPTTAAILKAIFANPAAFAHHDPLPAAPYLGDEGAANHTRLSDSHDTQGVEIFVYGRSKESNLPARFPARQTLEASSAVARLHQLDPAKTIVLRQSPAAIDAGAFHNDVVAVGNENVLLYHSAAYADGEEAMNQIRRAFNDKLHLIEIPEDRVSLKDAIETYLFNSQLVTLPDGTMCLIAPVECRERSSVASCMEELIAGKNPIRSAHFLDVRQSMKNGGGPACLRLRVVLTEEQLALVHPGVMLSESLYSSLVQWVSRHYRESIRPEDLADPQLAVESRTALDELTRILGLESIYGFQR